MKNNKNTTIYLTVAEKTLFSWQFKMIERLINADTNISKIYWTIVENESVFTKNQTTTTIPFFIASLFRIDSLLSHCKLTTLEPKEITDLTADIDSRIDFHQLSLNDFLKQIVKETTSSAVVINTNIDKLSDELLNKIPTDVVSVFIGESPTVVSYLTGIFEFISGKKSIKTGLQLERSGDDSIIIFSSSSSIEPPSFCRTLEACLQKTSVFLARYIKNKKLGSLTNSTHFTISPRTTKTKLSPHQKIKLLFLFFNRVSRRLIEKFTVNEQWILLLSKKDSSNPSQGLANFNEIVPPSDEFWADPFIYKHQNKNYLFLEVFPFQRELGHLSCMEIHEDGSYSDPVTILERPYHLSYPNVFEYEGSHYMIPESGDNATVELYKSTSFPYEWEYQYNLLEGIHAYDSTLFFHDGLWWLFAAVSEKLSNKQKTTTTEELYLFYADNPVSTHWTPHNNNPVISDAARARPAGKLFTQNNKIIRPSQDCAGAYGSGINFSEISLLTKDLYEEKLINKLTADWDTALTGVHTFNFNSDYTVSDAMLKRGRK